MVKIEERIAEPRPFDVDRAAVRRDRKRAIIGMVSLYAGATVVYGGVTQLEAGGLIAWAVVFAFVTTWVTGWLRGAAYGWVAAGWLVLFISGVFLAYMAEVARDMQNPEVYRMTVNVGYAVLSGAALVSVPIVPIVTVWALIANFRPVRPKGWRARRYFGTWPPPKGAPLI